MNWWWTVHERLFMWTFQELLMNCSWTIFFHNKFLNSSWTVMMNCSWTLVHEPTMRVFYELFMNCSWTFMNVHEQFIKSWTTFHRGTKCRSMLGVFSDNRGWLLLNLVHHPEVGSPYKKGYLYEKCRSEIKILNTMVICIYHI